MNALRLDNRHLPQGERDKFLRNAVQDLFHVESETSPLLDQPLQTTLEKHEVGHLMVVGIQGSSQQMLIPDWGKSGMVHLLLPRTAGGFIEAAGSRQALQQGCVYFVNVRGPLLIQTCDQFEHLAVFFPLDSSELTLAFIERCEAGSVPLSGGSAATLCSALLALQTNAPGIAPAAAPMVARSLVELFHAALVETLEAHRSPTFRLQNYHRDRIRRHARAALSDPALSVESTAAAVGLSVRRIHQLFSDGDMTLMRWIWSERLAQCHARLADSSTVGVRISDVAYEWGFSDPAHFSRAFRRRYGATPRQHVLRCRQGESQLPSTGHRR